MESKDTELMKKNVNYVNILMFYINLVENYFEQIYHVWEGYLRKIPVERRNISQAERQGNLVSRLVFFAITPPNMIYLFNYTEYYLEHWLNKYYNTLCLSFSGIFWFYWGFFRNVLTCYKPFEFFLFFLWVFRMNLAVWGTRG